MATGNAFGNVGERAHIVGARSGHEVAKGTFVSIADRFEVIEFRVGADLCDEVAVRIEPESFTAPDQAFDGVAVQLLVFSADVDCVLAARLNFH